MKKYLKVVLPILALLFVMSPAITAAVQIAEVHPVACAVAVPAIAALTYIIKAPALKGVFSFGIQREIWENDIVSNLYKNNQFLQYAFNADQYVLQGKVVHIPNAGAAPDVVKNRSSLPATVTSRTDVDITYDLDEYTSDPIKISNAESVELAYDKRASVTAEAQQKLRQEVAENMLVKWAAPTANVIKTTGGTTAATAPSGTGNRKLMVLADLQSAMTKMNRGDVPMEDRFALFSANMYDQFINSLNETQYRDFSRVFDPERGVLGMLYGFNIMMRSSTPVYDNDFAVKAYGATAAATDSESVICWQQNSVERALGEVKFFEHLGDPTHYADIYSFLMRMGGRIRRNDNKGVLAIVQDTPVS